MLLRKRSSTERAGRPGRSATTPAVDGASRPGDALTTIRPGRFDKRLIDVTSLVDGTVRIP